MPLCEASSGARPSGVSRLSDRNRPMCVAPLASTSRSSSGRSRLASRRMSMPSRVRAGPAKAPLSGRSQRTTGAASAVRRCQSARDEASPLIRHSPVDAVEIDRGAGRDRRGGPGDADHRRHAERAGQDRGVRRPAAAFGDEAGGPRPVDLRHRRRRRARRPPGPTAPDLPARRCRAIPSAGCRPAARPRRARRRDARAGTDRRRR